MTLPIPPSEDTLGARYEVQAYDRGLRAWSVYYRGDSRYMATMKVKQLRAGGKHPDVRCYAITVTKLDI